MPQHGWTQNYYVKCKKPDTKAYILYVLIYITFLDKGMIQRQKLMFTRGYVWD